MIDVEKYFRKADLLPAIIQEEATGEVLMLAYMNKVSLEKTLETGYTWFWSRSRQEYWNKGATSGNLQKVVSITSDCDNDTLLIYVNQTGGACHTGSYTCFFNKIYDANDLKTYVKNKKNVDIIKTISLPTGILENIELDVFDRDIEDGDSLVMCSDGIIESNTEYENKELWLKYLLENIETDNAQKIADLVLQEAIDNCVGQAKDDMTVMVMKINKCM